MCEFIILVRTKGGKDYAPSSLRSLVARSKEDANALPVSLMTSYLRRKEKPPSKQKELKKKGKGNKPNASVPLTSDELNTLYEKGLLGTQNPEARLNTLWPWLNNTMRFELRIQFFSKLDKHVVLLLINYIASQLIQHCKQNYYL